MVNIKENISLKFRFYIMSLWLLFLLIFFLTINVESIFDANGVYVGTLEILKRNWLALSSLALCFLGMFFALQINYEWKGVSNPPYEISSINEYSGFHVPAVRRCGNRLAIIKITRNLAQIKPAYAPQSGSGLDMGSISYLL